MADKGTAKKANTQVNAHFFSKMHGNQCLMYSFLFYLELIPLQSQFLPWHPEQPKMKKLQSNTSFFCPLLCPKTSLVHHWAQKKRALSDSFFILFCGERGIRTPGASQLNGFQDRRNRPLCHLSNAFKTRVFQNRLQRYNKKCIYANFLRKKCVLEQKKVRICCVWVISFHINNPLEAGF